MQNPSHVFPNFLGYSLNRGILRDAISKREDSDYRIACAAFAPLALLANTIAQVLTEDSLKSKFTKAEKELNIAANGDNKEAPLLAIDPSVEALNSIGSRNNKKHPTNMLG